MTRPTNNQFKALQMVRFPNLPWDSLELAFPPFEVKTPQCEDADRRVSSSTAKIPDRCEVVSGNSTKAYKLMFRHTKGGPSFTVYDQDYQSKLWPAGGPETEHLPQSICRKQNPPDNLLEGATNLLEALGELRNTFINSPSTLIHLQVSGKWFLWGQMVRGCMTDLSASEFESTYMTWAHLQNVFAPRESE